jgi:hypothetical protein
VLVHDGLTPLGIAYGLGSIAAGLLAATTAGALVRGRPSA